jgi:hypothetical protein
MPLTDEEKELKRRVQRPWLIGGGVAYLLCFFGGIICVGKYVGRSLGPNSLSLYVVLVCYTMFVTVLFLVFQLALWYGTWLTVQRRRRDRAESAQRPNDR